MVTGIDGGEGCSVGAWKVTQIDIDPWTSNEKSAKKAIGRAWSKWFHVSGIPDRNADNPYFISAVKQTQQCGM
jgi:hypothetical protein